MPRPLRGSVRFDRAAEFYDATRRIDDEALGKTMDVLSGEFAGKGRVLEIGVGTGALALPLHERGISLAGVDLSRPMLDKLVEKAGGRAPFPLLVGDATRLPLRSESFGGAYARWVLHLIPDWREAVKELCRVVRPGGVVIVEPGGYLGAWRDIWLKFVQEVGEAARAVGLDMRRQGVGDLDAAFEEAGARHRELPQVTYRSESTLERFFDEADRKLYSWTWRIPDEDLHRAVGVVRAWALERYGDLDWDPEPNVPLLWRAYDVPR
jgi:SAM-dependent methyltransferase